MSNSETSIWNQNMPQQFLSALFAIENKDTLGNFLRDVMTEKEILEISARFEAARMLSEGVTYAEISKKTKLSSRTVARISDWLKNGCSGYEAALNTVHHNHMSPDRAD